MSLLPALLLLAAGTAATAAEAQQAAPSAGAELVVERSIDDLSADLAAGRTSSEALVRAYLARIEAIDRKGPTLRSVIATNPDAIAQARMLDAERRAGRLRGPLHGIPVLVKDNIDTIGMATTAGSLALKDNMTNRDAPLVAKLRAAGAIILGKTNLSEWANIRSTRSMSGWSAVGGLVRNPYALDRTACGSSSGSGAAAAASLAAATVGTETDGSIVCPSSINGLVGMKPTLGLVSRTHVVPISHSQDTAGPMTRSVRDAALMLTAMAGSDPADAATAQADAKRVDYAKGLDANGLRGVRVGVVRPPNLSPDLARVFDTALEQLKTAGAVLVPVERPATPGMGAAEFSVLLTELKADLDAYLATTPKAVTARTLDAVIAFNAANAASEMPFFEQEIFLDAAKTKGLDDPAYRTARETSLRLAGKDGIDAMLAKANVALLVAPTAGAAWPSDPVHGDQSDGPSASSMPAIAGYPHLTVPMGLVDGLPVGLSFFSTAWRDAEVLKAGYAFEQRAKARVAPRYLPSVDAGPGLDGVR
ncbi:MULTISPECIES: amidase [unclassified Sphingomonas]|uniref:amidase n=1 Tax=unclassified Sphingomonas TaxID=196159 RepID=UPI00083376BB|nr:MULTISPECIES: amidase [unclassified Sphingomonas]